jgi:putative SOS response-associated peptidase YedK
MCTNYVPTRVDRLQAQWGRSPAREDYVAEAYPGYVAPFLRSAPLHSSDTLDIELGVFGLIPSWSRDGKNFRHCYNARSETVADKPSFRNAWRQRQWCVIPADAIFEPCYETGKAVRWRIERADGAPMALAGIWDAWRAPNGDPVLSFSMLTLNADAHPVMRRFHRADDEKRSVVMLEPESVMSWLQATHEEALALIRPFEGTQARTLEAPKARTPAVHTASSLTAPKGVSLFD